MIDVMHDFACPDGEALYQHALGIVAPLSKLRARAKRCGVPVVYLNDNFGRWRSSFSDTVARAEAGARGDIARRLHPGRSDLAVLKPGRSGFYASPLDLLLEQMGVKTLVLTGLSTDQCVLATASDAVLRKYLCAVPSDCSTAITRARHERALHVMHDAFDIDVRSSEHIAHDLFTAPPSRA